MTAAIVCRKHDRIRYEEIFCVHLTILLVTVQLPKDLFIRFELRLYTLIQMHGHELQGSVCCDILDLQPVVDSSGGGIYRNEQFQLSIPIVTIRQNVPTF